MSSKSPTLLVLLGSTLLGSTLLVITAVSCDPLECGEGTVEDNGLCVALMGQNDGGLRCGLNTTELNGVCVPLPDICGSGTELEIVIDDDGTESFVCTGQGSVDLPECPEAEPSGPICMTGWARYLVSPGASPRLMQTLITDSSWSATKIEVLAYDPLMYANDPNVAPLGVAEVDPHTGTFIITGITVGGAGFVALVIEDWSESPDDDFVFTGYPYEATAGFNMEGVPAYGVTTEQNDAWSADIGAGAIEAAGCPAGTDLLECGVWVGVYGYTEDNGTVVTVPGVDPNQGGSPIDYRRVFYLDESLDTFWAPASQAESYTTSTGTVFFPSSTLATYGGECSANSSDTQCADGNYAWSQVIGGAGPQAYFIQLRVPDSLL